MPSSTAGCLLLALSVVRLRRSAGMHRSGRGVRTVRLASGSSVAIINSGITGVVMAAEAIGSESK